LPGKAGGRKREEPASGAADPDASALQNAAKPGARGADAPDPELESELTGIFDGLAIAMEKQMLKALPPPPKDTKIKNADFTVDSKKNHHAKEGENGGEFITKDGDGATAKKPEEKSAEIAPPKRITVAEADARLTRGEKVTAVDGKEVNFGQRLKGKLEDPKHPEYGQQRRKELLEYAQDSVRSGQHIKETTNGDTRGVYYKEHEIVSIKDGVQKKKGIACIVSERDGEAFDIRYMNKGQALRKGLINRTRPAKKNRLPFTGAVACAMDWQPSRALLDAIVAADGNQLRGAKN
jgi:hypothetical protein